MNQRSTAFVFVALLVAFVFLPLALYAYRSQGPSITQVPITAAIQDVHGGRVRAVTIAGDRATLDLIEGAREQTVVPMPSDPLEPAVMEWNQKNPTRVITLRFDQAPVPSLFPPLAGVLLTLLPFVLLAAVAILAARVITRRTRADVYAELARAADLRDRGVLSQDEFEREKQKILGPR